MDPTREKPIDVFGQRAFGPKKVNAKEKVKEEDTKADKAAATPLKSSSPPPVASKKGRPPLKATLSKDDLPAAMKPKEPAAPPAPEKPPELMQTYSRLKPSDIKAQQQGKGKVKPTPPEKTKSDFKPGPQQQQPQQTFASRQSDTSTVTQAQKTMESTQNLKKQAEEFPLMKEALQNLQENYETKRTANNAVQKKLDQQYQNLKIFSEQLSFFSQTLIFDYRIAVSQLSLKDESLAELRLYLNGEKNLSPDQIKGLLKAAATQQILLNDTLVKDFIQDQIRRIPIMKEAFSLLQASAKSEIALVDLTLQLHNFKHFAFLLHMIETKEHEFLSLSEKANNQLLNDLPNISLKNSEGLRRYFQGAFLELSKVIPLLQKAAVAGS